MIGKTISHYRILEKLGEGGMGVVYKAEDTKLKRQVALKFLSHQALGGEENKARFINEARAVASLSHPNTCVVHEIDESEGKSFISMEYVEGQSIREMVASGPLEPDKVAEITLQIAEGLQEAHDKGIVHRDIKSANIMISLKGQVKIMDFGLAKSGQGMDVTKTGTTIGTIAYMSPEQVRGEGVDHRSDIWSLGVVMYEMLTGTLPFKGEYEPAVVYSILHESAEPVESIRDGVPKELERILDKMLAKEPPERYQRTEEIISDLSLFETSGVVPEHRGTLTQGEKSIVVLPFDDLSPGKDNEYFSDGLTEEIISDLSQVHNLRVISRSSAMTFKGTKKIVKAIGRELNVQYVLEGSVRKAGNKLRINAQLIDATNDRHLWSEKYGGFLDDVFDIQEKVSRSIVDALKIKLEPEEVRKIGERPIDSFEAYEFYLRARHEMYSWTEEGLDRALQYFQNGLDVIGENALLYAGIGLVHWWHFNIAVSPEEAHLIEAEKYAGKVFELEPNSAYGHRLMGFIQAFRRGLGAALLHLKKAHDLAPDDPDTLLFLGSTYVQLGKGSIGRRFIDRVLVLDPLTPLNYVSRVLFHLMEGESGAAVDVARQMYAMSPETAFVRFDYALALMYDRQIEEACEVIDRLVQDTPDVYPAQLGLFLKHAHMGENQRALDSLNPGLMDKAKWDFEIAWQMADGFALIDEKDKSIDCLEHSVNRGVIHYPFFSKHDPFLESIRGEERFKSLLARVKSEWESLDA
jgi:serine/threonine protein kinase